MLVWSHLRRPDHLFLSGKEVYYHLQEGTIAVIISFMNKYTGLDPILLAKMIPLILGLGSIVVFYHILRKLKVSYTVVVLSTLILIFSPKVVICFR